MRPGVRGLEAAQQSSFSAAPVLNLPTGQSWRYMGDSKNYGPLSGVLLSGDHSIFGSILGSLFWETP